MHVYRQTRKCSNVPLVSFKPSFNGLLLSSAIALWTLLLAIDITMMMLMTVVDDEKNYARCGNGGGVV